MMEPKEDLQSEESTSSSAFSIKIRNHNGQLIEVPAKPAANNILVVSKPSSENATKYQQCQKCPLKFKSAEAYYSHVKSHELEKCIYRCNKCSKLFKNKHYFAKHIIKRHMPSKSQGTKTSEKDFRCLKCAQSFASLRKYKTHAKSHETAPYQCTKCFLKFVSLHLFREHSKTHKENKLLNMYQCTQCQKVYKSKTQFEHHVKMHDVKSVICKCLCLVCKKPVTNFTQHFYAQHKWSVFKCEICVQDFRNKTEFFQHSYDHMTFEFEGEEKLNELDKKFSGFKCTTCSEEFDSFLEFTTHQSSHHENNKKEKGPVKKGDVMSECFDCGLKLSVKNMRGHCSSLHYLSYPWMCRVCERNCQSNRALIRHMDTHKEDGKTALYKCRFCKEDITFVSTADYKRHMMDLHTYHVNVELPHPQSGP